MIGVRTRRLLLWVALPALLLVLLYTVLGFFVVPRLIKSGAHDFVAKNYHRELRMGDVRFNPFTLRLDIREDALKKTENDVYPIVPGKPNQLTITGAGRSENTLVRALLVKPLRSTRMSISSSRMRRAAASSVMSLMSIQ